jgi:RNA polymerase sigma factor (TIGR02999 family)
MNLEKGSEITQILHEWNDGNTDAKDRLIPFVYEELKHQARLLMSKERSNHTLQPTALVHEAFIRITKSSGIDWKNRSHFYGIASHLMRQILVEHARRRASNKRGNNPIHFSLDDVDVSVEEHSNSILALDEMLETLAEMNEQQAQIVEMKFFGGLTNKEVAEALEISERSVAGKWQVARIWLYRELNQD